MCHDMHVLLDIAIVAGLTYLAQLRHLLSQATSQRWSRQQQQQLML
jgi:hypothetical protein